MENGKPFLSFFTWGPISLSLCYGYDCTHLFTELVDYPD